MQWRLLAPRYWPTWAGIGLLRLFALLPYSWVVALGGLLGAMMRLVARSFVRTARRNLELCFPELDGQARERLLDTAFRRVSGSRCWRYHSRGGARPSASRGSRTSRAASISKRPGARPRRDPAHRAFHGDGNGRPRARLGHPRRLPLPADEQRGVGLRAWPFSHRPRRPSDPAGRHPRVHSAHCATTNACGTRPTRATARRGRRWCACSAFPPPPTR